MTAPAPSPISASHPGGNVVIGARNLTKHFPIKEGALQRVTGHVRAVDGVTFDLKRGETLGLVGESGCGKTTLGRVVAGLADPSAGGVYFDLDDSTRSRLDELLATGDRRSTEESAELERLDTAHRVDRLQGEAWRTFRRNTQMVFQDSFASLNPRQLVRDIVGRPLRVHREATGSNLTERVVELLEQVGLGRQHLYRYPHQFSGGQRQRISIARALALDPELVILDEPTSALDVSVQAQILNLLHELQQDRGLSYLFVTHDLSVVRHMADRIVVMYLGRVTEAGSTEAIFESPFHPYTEALLLASPDVSEDEESEGFRGLEGSVPDPARPPQGCRFHTRCVYATPACGWEIDDVVLRLEDIPGMFDRLVGVERRSAFDADLRFDDQASAQALARTIRTEAPDAMQMAMEVLEVADSSVHIRFGEVDEVRLTGRGPGHEAACILDRLPSD
jgi:oligopeptide/dipeptide ABC transporter ATP-binding protein